MKKALVVGLLADNEARTPVNAREVLFPETVTRIDVITPRRYVALMNMSSAELGRALKDAVRDELYERRRKCVFHDTRAQIPRVVEQVFHEHASARSTRKRALRSCCEIKFWGC